MTWDREVGPDSGVKLALSVQPGAGSLERRNEL